MRKRVEFELHYFGGTPRSGRYIIVKSIPEKRVEELGIPTSFHHHWSDGHYARVSARVMEKGERRKRSSGFMRYDWMVERIIRWGTTECQHEWEPMSDAWTQARGGEWERCKHCGNCHEIAPEVTP